MPQTIRRARQFYAEFDANDDGSLTVALVTTAREPVVLAEVTVPDEPWLATSAHVCFGHELGSFPGCLV